MKTEDKWVYGDWREVDVPKECLPCRLCKRRCMAGETDIISPDGIFRIVAMCDKARDDQKQWVFQNRERCDG